MIVFQCFYHSSKIQSIEVSDTIKHLPDSCFSECSSLSSIIFHGQIESIGEFCFYKCSNLQSIELSASFKHLPDSCFSECSSLSSIIFHGQIESIGGDCFYKCCSLISIILPISLKQIEKSFHEGNFEGCLSFQNLSVCDLSLLTFCDFKETPFN
jgi:hypothetical protein